MKFAALTIFPRMFASFTEHGMIRRAIERGQIELTTIDIRDFAPGRHRVTDDRPYGGGCGMVMKPEPLAGAIRAARDQLPGAMTVHLSPQGRVFNQPTARALAAEKGLILVCGRYEGVDERVCQELIDTEVSIGDFILTGGELAAMVIIDAVARIIPGVLGGEDSAAKDTFSNGLLKHAQYTRPPVFEGESIPGELTSGHHARINRWRLESSLIRTFLKRPDLLKERLLNQEETDILGKWQDTLRQLLSRRAGTPEDFD